MALVLAAGACGSDDDDDAGGTTDTTAAPVQDEIGEGEGAVSIFAWPYYAEDGTQDPNYDWVSKFEDDTGCEASVKYFGTSDEAFTLFGTGDYDVVSASGDSSMRSVASGDAAPIQHGPPHELRRPGALPEGEAVELDRRHRLRRAPRVGSQRAAVQHRRGVARPRQLGCGVRP